LSIFCLDLALSGTAYFNLVAEIPPPLPPWLSYLTGAAGFDN